VIPVIGSGGILQERWWKVTGSFRKKPEFAGTLKQYSDRELFGFFPVESCTSRQKPGGKHWKKSEKFPAGIMLPQNHWEPNFFEPDCSTWY
jgi:hypothetical protein